MRPRIYKTQGIVLARRDYSEADRILSVLTRNWGRISMIAKSVRKPKSRKRAHIEVFNYINFSAGKGRGIDIIYEVEIVDNFLEIRKNLKKVSLAYYFMEVIGKITAENQPNTELFETLLKYLNLLKGETKLKRLRLSFIYEILIDLGFWPKEKVLDDADQKLSEILERNLSSVRVGKKLLS